MGRIVFLYTLTLWGKLFKSTVGNLCHHFLLRVSPYNRQIALIYFIAITFAAMTANTITKKFLLHAMDTSMWYVHVLYYICRFTEVHCVFLFIPVIYFINSLLNFDNIGYTGHLINTCFQFLPVFIALSLIEMFMLSA